MSGKIGGGTKTALDSSLASGASSFNTDAFNRMIQANYLKKFAI